MQKQRHYYNYPQISTKLIQSISKGTGLQKRKRKTLERISLLTLLLLIYLVASISNNFLSTRARLTKRTRTTKEVFGTIKGIDRVVVMVFCNTCQRQYYQGGERRLLHQVF